MLYIRNKFSKLKSTVVFWKINVNTKKALRRKINFRLSYLRAKNCKMYTFYKSLKLYFLYCPTKSVKTTNLIYKFSSVALSRQHITFGDHWCYSQDSSNNLVLPSFPGFFLWKRDPGHKAAIHESIEVVMKEGY